MTLSSQKGALLAAALPPPPSNALSADSDATGEPGLSPRQRLIDAATRHAALVWRLLRRFGVPERDVEDAAQQVYLALSQRLSQVEMGKEAGFLAAVAVRVAANARRKLERSREVLTDNFETVVGAHTPEALLNEKQLRQELDRGLATLSLDQRAVFVLFELEGFSLPEIAEALHVPLGTATSRLRRARVYFEAWVRARRGDAGGGT